ncbi:Multidrug resistance protein 1, partial [Tetrabaena socialis]
IRTVAAYNREEAAMIQYGKALDEPRKQDVRRAWMGGASFGAIQFVMYGTYAVGLFFGAYRVAAGAYTGGQVLQVLIATLMGGFSLGQ